MIILILQVVALAFIIISTISLLWLLLLNANLNSSRLANYWQSKLIKARIPENVWGTVFDSSTKKPIKDVVVKMYNAETKELMATTLSNNKGDFGFRVPSQKFYLRASSLFHLFPSIKMLKEYRPKLARRREEKPDYFGLFVKSTDELHYKNLYFGEIINNRGRALQKSLAKESLVKEIHKIPLNLNIPLDFSTVITIDDEALEGIASKGKAYSGLKWTTVILGILICSYLLITSPGIVSLFLFELLFILFVINAYEGSKTTYIGKVLDQKGAAIDYALIRARGYASKKIRATAISNNEGVFKIRMFPGWHTLETSRNDYTWEKRLVKCGPGGENPKMKFKLEKRAP